MSGRLVGAALEAELDAIPRTRRRSCRAVLVILAEATGRAGVAWPSTATIARRAELSTRQVRRILTELEEAGVIATDGTRAGGAEGATRWRLLLPRMGEDTGVRGARTRVSSEPEENRYPPLPPAERGELDHRWTATPAPLPAELHLPGMGPREQGASPRALGTNPRARRRELERDAARAASAALDADLERRRREAAELEERARSPEALEAMAAVRARILKR